MAKYLQNASIIIAISFMINLQVQFLSVGGWQGDLFYFTSFDNVSEWEQLYFQCNLSHDYSFQEIHDPALIPHTLSPIALPSPDKAIPVDHKDEPQVLLIYNNPPPDTADYTVSFGFQKNKECLSNTASRTCYVSPSFGKVRGVVLNAERPRLKSIKENFTVEGPEKFVTILNGGFTGERKFYEALFLGNPEGSDGFRSTHTIDGKSYPMEIYMFFVDESYPALVTTTVLVVLVEESEEDNHEIRPVLDAVKYNLYEEERRFLRRQEKATGRELMYHHMGPSIHEVPALGPDGQPGQPIIFPLPRSSNIEKADDSRLELFERFISVEFRQTFVIEDLVQTRVRIKDLREELAINPYTGLDGALFSEYIIGFFDGNATQRLFGNLTLPDPSDPGYKFQFAVANFCDATVNFEKTLEGIINTTSVQTATVEIREAEKTVKSMEEAVFMELRQNPGPNFQQRPDLATRIELLILIINLDEAMQRNDLQKKKLDLNQGWVLSDLTFNALSRSRQLTFDSIYDPSNHPDQNQENYVRYKHIGRPELGNLGMTEEQYEDYLKLSHVKVKLKQKFQVSWLLPKGGGYYIYTGSSPVPPCYRVRETLVFRKPIKMTKEQIRGLTTMPTSFHKRDDIRNTLPRLHPLRRPNFPIYFEKRNHQFLNNDEVHKNSIFEAAKRRQG